MAAAAHEEAADRGGGAWVDEKTMSSDFVSDVDMAAQEAALDVIAARHPHHRILAEEDDGSGAGAAGEGGGRPGEDAGPGDGGDPGGGGRPGAEGSEHLWLVDPLDGTTNFLHGHPYHAASVAVWDSWGPLAAAVDARALGKTWFAARGRGAYENGRRIQVSRTTRIGRYLLGTGFPFKTHDVLTPYLAELDRALRQTSGVRRTGAAAIDLAYVANGILDGFWESRLAPWDFGAGVLLVTEAGGVVERVEGGPLDATGGSVMAANSRAGLERMREVLGA